MIVATTETLLINAVSPKGERIIVWKTKDWMFNAFHLFPTSEVVTIISYGSMSKLFDSMDFHDWVLAGVAKNSEIETALKEYFVK